jgi:hypothetical protein
MSDVADRLAQAIRDLINEAAQAQLNGGLHSHHQHPGNRGKGSSPSLRPGSSWPGSVPRRSTSQSTPVTSQ